MSKRIIFLHFSLLSLAVLACQNNSKTTNDLASTDQQEEAKKAAYDTYETFDELAPLFQKNNDTTYVINFWATWCKPCVEELPYFQQLHEAYRGEKVKVVLVSLDFPHQIESKFIPFLEREKLGPDIALLLDGDANSWIDRVNPEWGGAIPVTLVYKGQERAFHGTQFSSYQELKDMVETMM